MQNALILSQTGSIISELKEKYPETLKLLNYNREGTLELLRASGAVKTMTINKYLNMPPSSGNDNYKAWEEYKANVDAYLYSVNSDSELRGARMELAKHIKKKHYDRYPTWPKVGKTQSSYIDLNIYNTYESGVWSIVWSCDGFLKVTDSRPERKKYIANFEGKPKIRLLKLNHAQLRKVEKLTYNNFGNAKKEADKLKTLTWDSLLGR